MKLHLDIQTADPTHVQIERFLRRRIMDGSLAPGQGLPATSLLSRQWKVDHTSIQKAMSRLVADGLIERKPRRGTFVKAQERQATIGVLFGPDLADEPAHFYRALLRSIEEEVRSQERERRWSCRSYSGLTFLRDESQPPERASAYKRLLGDLGDITFNGMLLAAPGAAWARQLDERFKLPTVIADVDVIFDRRHFVDEALRRIRQHGRKRIAHAQVEVVDATYVRADSGRELAQAAGKAGFAPPTLVKFAVQGEYHLREEIIFEQAVGVLRSWKKLPPAKRPDALVVPDDIVMRAVAMALLKEGVRAPEELLVVCMANEGIHFCYGLPVLRYEFSSRAMAVAMIDLLWRRMAGESVPGVPIMIQGKIE